MPAFRCFAFTKLLLVALASGTSLPWAHGQPFETIINLPSVADGTQLREETIGPNTQLNVYPGGLLHYVYFGLRDQFNENVEVNFFGGEATGSVFASPGAQLNVFEGTLRGLYISPGAAGTVETGNFDSLVVLQDFDPDFGPALLTVQGGYFADRLFLGEGSLLELVGGNFAINGVPVAGLDQVGDVASVQVPVDSQLTGVFADGTPFAFLTNQAVPSFQGDAISGRPIQLQLASLPPIAGPMLITASTDEVPQSIRAGQQLVIDSGGQLPGRFIAGEGSRVVVQEGGFIGPTPDYFGVFKAIGAEVEIQGGEVLRKLLALTGTNVSMRSGLLYDFAAAAGSSVLFEGDVLVAGEFHAAPGSSVRVASGNIGSGFVAHPGSNVTFVGGEFHVDGEPVAGLAAPGASLVLDVPEGSVLTGTLTHGTPVGYTGGRFTLEAAPVPPRGPAQIIAGQDPVPAAIRRGQQLIVADGGMVGERFIAGGGSSIQLDEGGAIGTYLQLIEADLQISGGEIGWGMVARDGSTIRMSGGAIQGDVEVRNSTLQLSGGNIERNLQLTEGSILNMSGGFIADLSRASSGSTVNLTGGTLQRRFTVDSGAVINIDTGEEEFVGQYVGANGGIINLHSGQSSGGITTVNGGVFNMMPGSSIRTATIGGFRSITQTTANIMGGQITNEILVRQNGFGRFTGGTTAALTAEWGGQAELAADAVFDTVRIREGSSVTISGGTVQTVTSIYENSVAEVTGGKFTGEFLVRFGSVASVSGGDFTEVELFLLDASLHLRGTQFLIDGEDISHSLQPNMPLAITQRDVLLQGRLADGSFFEFDFKQTNRPSGDYFSPDSLLTVTLVPEPTAAGMLLMALLALTPNEIRRCRR